MAVQWGKGVSLFSPFVIGRFSPARRPALAFYDPTITKGTHTYNVRKIFGILDPPSTLCTDIKYKNHATYLSSYSFGGLPSLPNLPIVNVICVYVSQRQQRPDVLFRPRGIATVSSSSSLYLSCPPRSYLSWRPLEHQAASHPPRCRLPRFYLKKERRRHYRVATHCSRSTSSMHVRVLN